MKGLRVGGILLGIGVAVTLASVVIVDQSFSSVGLFGLTAGVILMAIALLTLLISALIAASSD
jgi:hypothetical protein